MSYVREKLYQATLSLTGEGPIDQRLYYAGLALIRVMDSHPFKDQAFKDDFFDMMKAFTAPTEPAPDGYILANVARMDDAEKRTLVERIVGMLWTGDVLS